MNDIIGSIKTKTIITTIPSKAANIKNPIAIEVEVGKDSKIEGSIGGSNTLDGLISSAQGLIGDVSTKNEVNVSIKSSGAKGKDGMNAYEMWLERGNEGTLDDFFNSLKGKDGENYIHPDTHSADMIVETDERNFISFDEKTRALTTFIYEQKEASASWVIEHDLDKYPSVSVVDSADSLVGGSVEYISKNMVEVTFTAAFSGKAYLN